jgi:hypothetical protein
MELVAKDYDAICERLGFSPESKFVVIEDGKISFSVGKPDELRQLFQRADHAGYEMSPKLLAMERILFPHRY